MFVWTGLNIEEKKCLVTGILPHIFLCAAEQQNAYFLIYVHNTFTTLNFSFLQSLPYVYLPVLFFLLYINGLIFSCQYFSLQE